MLSVGSSCCGFRFQIQIYGFADVFEGFFPGFSLRPTAFERRDVSHKIAVFAALDYYFDIHKHSNVY
jgi:hypothetical protein